MALSGQALAIAVVLVGQLAGPPQTRDAMSGLIVGQVVDGDSGRPLAGALVAASSPLPSTGSPLPRVITGADGRFVFRGLRRGAYSIIAFKAGFSEGAHGRTRPAGPAVPLT
ncbi:MAG: carboxypeptidase regulatory-like domain-containing protein, partial [Acidobacteria bacterium]|nr:carboxypeptidase regulatory-like domain-containing protein [Acidobacteriota bacterium]